MVAFMLRYVISTSHVIRVIAVKISAAKTWHSFLISWKVFVRVPKFCINSSDSNRIKQEARDDDYAAARVITVILLQITYLYSWNTTNIQVLHTGVTVVPGRCKWSSG